MSEQVINWKLVRQKAGPYPDEAFKFVSDGLCHTAKVVHGDSTARETARGHIGPDRHVNGSQLCLGLRDYAIQRYGMLARTVLERWGIVKTDDFGRIVFAMIDAGLLRKSSEDAESDFHAVFDFDEAFNESTLC